MDRKDAENLPKLAFRKQTKQNSRQHTAAPVRFSLACDFSAQGWNSLFGNK